MRSNALRTVLLLIALSVSAGAQSAGSHIAEGDREYRALRAEAALEHYELAVAADSTSYEARWKTSRSALDLGSNRANAARSRELFKTGERHARRAVEINPGDAEGYFSLARALGKTAQSLGVRDKVKYATTIRRHALECLRLNPRHSGCNHVLGVWNAEVMRLSGFERMIARNFLGGRALGSASWAEAQRYLEQAVSLAPERIIHHLELGDVYRDRGDRARARRSYETAIRLPATDYNDAQYKAHAEAELRRP